MLIKQLDDSLLSSEHFSVDGTLLRAWPPTARWGASTSLLTIHHRPVLAKGFGGNASGKKRAKGDFRGLRLSNQTHRSSSVAEAQLFKKAPGVGAFLSFMGHCVGFPRWFSSFLRTKSRNSWVSVRWPHRQSACDAQSS